MFILTNIHIFCKNQFGYFKIHIIKGEFMIKNRISTQFLLYFFMMMFLVVIGCSSSSDNPAPAPAAYTQADLTGTWQAHMLQAGTTNEWQYVTVTIDSTGTLSFVECHSPTSTTCPTGPIVWTINSSGVISETDNGTATDSHYTMTSNKNFISGTGTGGGDTDYQLLIAQKVVTGTTYNSSDVLSQTFVLHQLVVGATDNEWYYGTLSTDSSGAITQTSWTSHYGTDSTADVTGIKLSVGTDGVVLMDEVASFQGFLSDDKKTIVATYTDVAGNYRLSIFQITAGQSDTAGALPAQTGIGHMLAVGASPAPLWAHETITVASGGGITESDWVSSPSISLTSTTMTGSITSTGTVTIAEDASQNGQMSYDGKFIVLTGTRGSGVYSLEVITK